MGKKGKKEEANISSFKTEAEIKAESLKRLEEERQKELSRPKSRFAAWVENYWYHYRTATFVLLFVAVVGAIIIQDVLEPKPDVKVAFVASAFYPYEMQDILKASLEKYAPDINVDGKIVVLLDHIPFNPNSEAAGTEEDYTYALKLAAIIASGDEQIFILDQPNLEYLSKMVDENSPDIFLDLNDIPGAEDNALSVMSTKLADDLEAKYYENLAIYVRDFAETKSNAESLKGNWEFILNLVEE